MSGTAAGWRIPVALLVLWLTKNRGWLLLAGAGAAGLALAAYLSG